MPLERLPADDFDPRPRRRRQLLVVAAVTNHVRGLIPKRKFIGYTASDANVTMTRSSIDRPMLAFHL